MPSEATLLPDAELCWRRAGMIQLKESQDVAASPARRPKRPLSISLPPLPKLKSIKQLPDEPQTARPKDDEASTPTKPSSKKARSTRKQDNLQVPAIAIPSQAAAYPYTPEPQSVHEDSITWRIPSPKPPQPRSYDEQSEKSTESEMTSSSPASLPIERQRNSEYWHEDQWPCG